jgi:putative ubiquitin-RnfH superfamily antitoxin RatB of RatAB toxin-antitoxin module
VSATLTVHLLYSPRAREVLERELSVPSGTTVLQAIQASGLLQDHPEIDISHTQAYGVGIWGRKTTPHHVLRDGDRLEIYRALTVDPKVARRERFQKQGVGRAGLFAKRRPGAKPGY